MKIIILAAGRGTRLMPLTRNTPKPLIDIGNGYTLLERQLDGIMESGVVDEVILVIGYLSEQIEAKVKKIHEDGLKIKTIYNPFFDVSNNLISLWLAMSEMTTDFMITNGDNLFDPEIFSELVSNHNNGIALAISKKEHYDTDDMKVSLSSGYLTEVNKTILTANTDAESPGLAIVKGDLSCKLFCNNLDQLIRKPESRHNYWLEFFNYTIANGNVINTWEIPLGMNWQEVDFHLDVNKVIELLDVRS